MTYLYQYLSREAFRDRPAKSNSMQGKEYTTVDSLNDFNFLDGSVETSQTNILDQQHQDDKVFQHKSANA